MRPRFTLVCSLLLTLAVAQSSAAAAPGAFKGEPVSGKQKSLDERCQECHGADGNANDIGDGVGNEGKFPKLAGQQPRYLQKQLGDFRSGKRKNDIMEIMARSLDEADIPDILAYFTSQPLRPEHQGEYPAGRALYTQGDPARGILPCVGCHGETARGSADANPAVPSLAGQHRRYLVTQLSAWRAGSRQNSDGRIMNLISQALSDAEIAQLADYLSALGRP